jgi:hypothetical protein
MSDKNFHGVKPIYQFRYTLPFAQSSSTAVIYAETIEAAQAKLRARIPPTAEILAGTDVFSFGELCVGCRGPQIQHELNPLDRDEIIADAARLPFHQLPGRYSKLFQALNHAKG